MRSRAGVNRAARQMSSSLGPGGCVHISVPTLVTFLLQVEASGGSVGLGVNQENPQVCEEHSRAGGSLV